MLVPILLFLVGLVLLIKGGDWFVDGATGIAHRFRMSELLIGATVVSIGTTLPEVMVSVTSAFQGVGGMAYGNAIGSVVCNAALIAALTMAIRPAKTNRKLLIVPVLFFFSAAVLYLIAAYFLGEFSRLVGVLLLLIFISYMTVSILTAKRTPDPIPETPEIENAAPSAEETAQASHPLWVELILLVLGAAAIAFGADLLVDNGQILAAYLGVPETIIALIFISLGTSLPELVTAITALIKGHSSLSLGNIIGANFLNLTLVSGISALIGPFDLPVTSELFGIPSSLLIELPVMIAAMLLLTVPTVIRNRGSRVQGILLLALYAAFCCVTLLL
ncbi:MAG: calcium/sodium antiporter [Clostridia bacterium]|nr:calcium/sodium antiporter [Clostridia bacterium]